MRTLLLCHCAHAVSLWWCSRCVIVLARRVAPLCLGQEMKDAGTLAGDDVAGEAMASEPGRLVVGEAVREEQTMAEAQREGGAAEEAAGRAASADSEDEDKGSG